MAASYHHGVSVTEQSATTAALSTVDTSVIGMVCTGSDADAATFPLDTPVLITDVTSAVGKGGTKGTLAASLQAIADQTSPVTVVVRVADGAGEDATTQAASLTSNVIGGSVNGRYTGMQALLAAQSRVGVKPRILGAPGLDTQAVTTALATLAPKLRAMTYASAGPSQTVTDAIAYQKLFSARELMLIWPDFTAWDTTTSAEVTAYAVARALGLRALIDDTQGWNKTLSNVPVAGVTGISADVHWDLQTAGTDADLLNQACVTTLINASSGYRFWGSRTCSADPDFVFESATRTAQVLADTIADSMLQFVDKPIHASLAKDIIAAINAKFRSLTGQGYILGGSAWIDTTINDSTTLKSGQMTISYDYTPTPPLEQLGLIQQISDTYLASLASSATSTSSSS